MEVEPMRRREVWAYPAAEERWEFGRLRGWVWWLGFETKRKKKRWKWVG